jgi:hypothetical protein
MKKIFTLILFLLFSIPLFSQSITWQRLYDGPPPNAGDYSSAICEATNGNFYISGYNLVGGFKGVVYKLNSNGDTIWVRVINTLQIISMTSSNDGGCVITGETRNPPNPRYPFILKLDSNGNTAWLKYYQKGIRPDDIIKTTDGGYVICGKSPSFDPGYGFVLKTDSEGNLQWLKNYIINYVTYFHSIIESHDEGYLITGRTLECFECSGNSFTLKVNNNGDSISTILFDFSEYLKIQKLKNGYIIAGNMWDTLANSVQIFIKKLSLSGKLYFQKFLNSNGRDFLKDIKVINENKYVISAEYDTLGKTVGGTYIVDSIGNFLYRNFFDYANWDFCQLFSILLFNSGDIGFVGTVRLNSTPNWQDIFVARTDSTLFSKPLSINKINSFVFKDYNLYQNYPNPFNPSTKIKIEIPNAFNVKKELKIFDILGREIQMFVLDKSASGTYEVEFNAKGLSSGVYFYSLIIDGNVFQTRKMILIY